MAVSADLIIPASTQAELVEICSWDGFRPGTYAPTEFPVDVVRFEGAQSRPVILSRSKRAESLKALPATLRTRAQAAFERAASRLATFRLPRGRRLDLSAGPVLMGIVNVTPDSFSDGGLRLDANRAIEDAVRMFEEGAGIVDVGGESTRPRNYGEAAEVPAAEEIRRVLPVVEGIRRVSDRPISVDTRKAEVARAALAAGADVVNDVSALRYDAAMAGEAARGNAAVVLMHMRGLDPRRMQEDLAYGHLPGEVAAALAQAAGAAREAGIPADAIAVDPGFGFGKTPEGNLVLMRHLAAFCSLGFPVASGASRKGFVRRFSGIGENASAAERLPGSLACVAAAAAAGASFIRVHDVAESARFLRMLAAIRDPAPAVSSAGAAAR
jgi:dihydropteroate synthase